MAEPARRNEPVTLEAFRGMAFGNRRAELIGGVVVVAHAFPSSRHGRVVASLSVALSNAIDSAGAECAVESGTGLDIRLEADFSLGPDVMVRCGEDPGDPVLVAKVLSPSNGAAEMLQKLRAYQSVESITDILILDQDRAYVEHWSRRPDEPWTAPERRLGLEASIRVARFDADVPLAALYRTALR